MKKLFITLLAVVLSIGLCATAMASSSGTTTSVTVQFNKDVATGSTYNFYKIFDLSYSASGSTSAYTYTMASKYQAYYESDTTFKSLIDAYFTIDAVSGAITAKTALTDTTVKTFASSLADWISSNKVAADKSYTVDGTESLISADENETMKSFTVTVLDYGYWLMDSDVGTTFTLDSIYPSRTISDKNTPPTQEKNVENFSGNWVDENSEQVGKTVNYRVVVNVKGGATNYVVSDTLSKGLTVNSTSADGVPSVVVRFKASDADDTQETNLPIVPSTYYTVSAATTDDSTGYTTFTVEFKNSLFTESWTDSSGNSHSAVGEGSQLRLYYSATVNTDAAEYEYVTNKSKLDYGNEQSTTYDEVKTYTFEFDLVKYTGEAGSETLLAGAEFKLYIGNSEANDTETEMSYNLVYFTVSSDGKTYTVVPYGTTGSTDTIKAYTTDDQGKKVASIVTIKGLRGHMEDGSAQMYTLKEVTTPEGYNKAADTVISISNDDIKFKSTDSGTWGLGGVQVENKSGSELPSTGGIGTTVFYVIGGLLMLGAVVLLVARKKTGAAN